MARPPAPENRRRSLRLSIRFNAAEAQSLAAAAAASRLTVSEVLRRAALQLPARRPPAERQDLAKLLGQVGKIGSNINQLARTANAGSWPQDQALRQACADVAWIRSTLMRALHVEDGDGPRPGRRPRGGGAESDHSGSGQHPQP